MEELYLLPFPPSPPPSCAVVEVCGGGEVLHLAPSRPPDSAPSETVAPAFWEPWVSWGCGGSVVGVW
ncbi:hypothetical protein E2C01_073357 [Portunus trituberculatus]|uniref:Uncharacterized protein n=1 Tax=Portunus trituberculatus TaxID=210409 RepID=A0A5B7I9J9_PORTR|nr:hypothetical protein [Portunus trituberculatus]